MEKLAGKKRLDVLLVERGLFESREKARVHIIAGEVKVNGETVRVPSKKFDDGIEIEVVEKMRYVSRGGIKLEGALKGFNLEVRGRVAVDIGASTGGFTDCLLQNGVKKVYAVDVGKGQLAWKLRRDGRVVVIEKFNARYLDSLSFDPPPDLAVVDVSFISLTKILPPLFRVLVRPFDAVVLVKPQFELTRKEVSPTKGVVKSWELHEKAVKKIYDFCTSEGFCVLGAVASPILGDKGNREFFLHISDSGESVEWENVKKVVWGSGERGSD